ncbi:MAG TPA: response regulator transcription factor [Bacteroidales bacterium]|nr:response regulator transcription factor [Bacteroidales bacterium]HOU95548.1 response regulator transcription factor [Bacteroidales bacterium]HQG36169.1 response regulator transcription factor [Bacteroidales bacterium]HQG53381.1 response regulator transcription factor [Bacteroidales bacterium]HQJ20293.1 response regulator transcription factor [Bacteroidales bacterium]
MKVLIAEDDRDFGNILAQYVTINGFDVKLARDGKEAWEMFNTEKPDICVFDVMMPEMDGFTLAEKVKNAAPEMPFIFLTAKSLKEDIVKGLKLGADDYITKPFDPEVLILRINNILKRAYSSANEEYHISKSILKFNTLELISGKKKEKLTLKEAQLLRYFILNKNKILTREDILTEIWGEDDYFLGRSMDVFISRLRKYLSEDKGIDIRTVRGTGFILEEVTNQKEKEED